MLQNIKIWEAAKNVDDHASQPKTQNLVKDLHPTKSFHLRIVQLKSLPVLKSLEHFKNRLESFE